jgi:hypothetical protein
MSTILTILAGLAGPAPATEEPPAVPMVVLEDQFGRPHFIARERGDVVVLVYGDRGGSAACQSLANDVHIHFHPSAEGLPPARARAAPARPIKDWPEGARQPDVRVVPIVCIGKVPPLLAGSVRSQFRARSPEVPVCLDFEDKTKQQFGLAAGVANVVVVDTLGRVRFRAHGHIDTKHFYQLAQYVEQLRRSPLPGGMTNDEGRMTKEYPMTNDQ